MPEAEPILYYNRYTGEIETELVYGENFLKFTYGNPLGKLALSALVRRGCFSRYYGWRMRQPASARKIKPFVVRYGLDVAEFDEQISEFEHFDAFFVRRLRAGARPFPENENELGFPAEGRHLAVADLSSYDGLWAKGQKFDLIRLLGSVQLAERYAGGAALISRLCPTDYHRYHFPCAGQAGDTQLMNGFLYSVNPIALRQQVSYLWENKRCMTMLESPVFGSVALLEIGATCVGSIVQSYTPGSVQKGDEKGYFRFGGSMFMMFFEPGRVRFSPDLLENGAEGREVYARVGDSCGHLCGTE
jgi:phosphatidylserine decarboxylase